MSLERYCEVVTQMCGVVGLADADSVLRRGCLEVEGFEVSLTHFQNDPQAMYLGFNFGAMTAGRTLKVYRLMLEANLTVYAQDQAQMGMDPDTGAVLLMLRAPLVDGIDGPWLADTLAHYTEHGRYWRDSIMNAGDEAYEGLCGGQYHWMKA
jgi:hypothetical protein